MCIYHKKKKTWEKDDVSKKKYFHVTTIILKFTYLKWSLTIIFNNSHIFLNTQETNQPMNTYSIHFYVYKRWYQFWII